MPKGLTPVEKKFLRLYVKEGGVAEKLGVIETRMRLKAGGGAGLLKLKRVQAAFERLMAPVRLEQERQRMVGDAVAEVTAKLEAEAAALREQLAAATRMPEMRVSGSEIVIEQELMRLVRLDPEKHGRVKLAAIQSAYVVLGTIEQGKTRRVTPLDGEAKPLAGGGTYSGLFDDLRAADAPSAEIAVSPAPDEPDELYPVMPRVIAAAQPVVSVMPVPKVAQAPVVAVAPASPTKAPARTKPDVITIEVG